MHELTCPSCNTPGYFNIPDYLHLCQFCSKSFTYERNTGQKEIFGDHLIVPNTVDQAAVKDAALEFIKRIHHQPKGVEQEFVITHVNGVSIPHWITSLDAISVWKGLVKRQGRNQLVQKPGAEYLTESGQFKRSYRWAINARSNICEYWGMPRLHEPKEYLDADWDGFPLDTTLSRGKLYEPTSHSNSDSDSSIYERREPFDFKFANGLPILGIQVSEEEALRRTQQQVRNYHTSVAKLNLDYLVDIRTELEIAGIQLVHLPFWVVSYQYRPKGALKHFYVPETKHLLLEGVERGVLKNELALVYSDKVKVNAYVSLASSFVFFILGALWHPAFFLVSLFSMIIAGASAYISTVRNQQREAGSSKTNGAILVNASAPKVPAKG